MSPLGNTFSVSGRMAGQQGPSYGEAGAAGGGGAKNLAAMELQNERSERPGKVVQRGLGIYLTIQAVIWFQGVPEGIVKGRSTV
jgi:hypothetical protein